MPTLPNNIEVTEEFKTVVDTLRKSQAHMFITGNAGTGKSTLLRYLVDEALADKEIVVLSPTGLSALNVGGQTIHKFFWFPTHFLTLKDVKYQKKNKSLFRALDMIIIDEISMVRADTMDAIDMALRVNRDQPHVPFGGVQMVFFGDMHQLPPIVDNELMKYMEAKYETPFFFSANVFKDARMKGIELTKPFRHLTDPTFITLLNKIRNNTVNVQDINTLNVACSMSNEFPEGDEQFPVRLMSTNAMAENVNRERLTALSGEPIYYEADTVGEFEPKDYPTDAWMPLKVGAQVMLIRNDPEGKFVNGSVGVVSELLPDKIVVHVNGRYVEVKKVKWEKIGYSFDGGGIYPEVLGEFEQYPLRLAWAITVHKCVSLSERVPVLERGLIKFSDLKENDITPYGKILSINQTTQPAFRITTKRGYIVVCSGEHRWQTQRSMIETRMLETTDRIKLATIPSFNGSNEMTTEFAWFIGVLVGDGSYTDTKSGRLDFACETETMRDRYINFMYSQGVYASLNADKGGVHSHSKPFRDKLYSMGLEYVKSPEKTIPESVWRSGPLVWAAFLQGLFDADGSVGKSTIIFCTRSELLSQQVQLLLLGLGIVCTRRVYKTGYKGRGDLYWQLFLPSFHLRTYETIIGFSHPQKKSKLSTIMPNRSIVSFDGYDNILCVEDLNRTIPMVDVEIPSPHLLSFSGFVGHNSQGMTYDRAVIDLGRGAFAAGQTYVALSRCRTMQGMRFGTSLRMSDVIFDDRIVDFHNRFIKEGQEST